MGIYMKVSKQLDKQYFSDYVECRSRFNEASSRTTVEWDDDDSRISRRRFIWGRKVNASKMRV